MHLLSGIRVLDLAGAAGAYAAKLMADQGADVIRVEQPSELDDVRRLPPFLHGQVDGEHSLNHHFLNTNKRSITLNLDCADGLDLFRRLLATAEVVIETSPPGTWKTRGLTYPEAQTIRPSLVWTAITPFGQTGPYAEFAGADIVEWAMGGLLYLAGYPDREPVKPYGSQAYTVASLYSAVATMLAIYHAEGTGEGQFIDVSIQECIASTLENASQYYDLEGVIRRRRGWGPARAGIGMYPCQDGLIYLHAAGYGASQGWAGVVRWLNDAGIEGAQELRKPEWQEGGFREGQEAQEYFRKLFTPFAGARTKKELYEAAQRYGIPVCPVDSPADILQNEQLRARGFFVEATGGDRPIVYPGPPFLSEVAPARAPQPGPRLGEHNRDIYQDELGIAEQDMAILKAAGAI